MARPDPQDRHQDRVLTPPASTARDEGFARALGSRVAALCWDDLPEAALHWAKVGILDTVGVTLAGSREDAPRLVARALDLAPGPALLFGDVRRVGTLDAAYINGTASHALDFDDCNNTLGGHPSAPVLSALFPLADELGCSGRDFIVAYVAGFEVETKLALAVNFHHYTKGWHPTATLGVFGAAAACARLMGLDAEKTAVALALAASFASGIKANFGTMAKPHARRPQRAQRRARGAPRGRRLHRQRARRVRARPGLPRRVQRPRHLRRRTRARRVGQAARHPQARHRDQAVSVLRQHASGDRRDARARATRRRIAPEDVERIDAWIHARRLKHTNRPAPDSPLDAKFSLQYVLARALIDHAVGVADFEPDSYRDARVQALLPRIHVAPYDDTQFAADNHFGGAVSVTLRDGRVETARVEQALGRTSDNPVPADRLRRKFDLCAATVLRGDAVEPIAAAIAGVEALPDMRALSNLIMTAHDTPSSLRKQGSSVVDVTPLDSRLRGNDRGTLN